MTMPKKRTSEGMRFGIESQQEQQSLTQVREWLAGWNTNRVENDLGEDLLVQIFDDGVASGVHFYLQVKSTANLEKGRSPTRPPSTVRIATLPFINP